MKRLRQSESCGGDVTCGGAGAARPASSTGRPIGERLQVVYLGTCHLISNKSSTGIFTDN